MDSKGYHWLRHYLSLDPHKAPQDRIANCTWPYHAIAGGNYCPLWSDACIRPNVEQHIGRDYENEPTYIDAQSLIYICIE